MATNTFTRYVAKNVGTTPAVLVTAASATQTTIIGATIANTTTSPITADLYITSSAVNYYIVKGATVPVGGSLALFGSDGKLVINTGDAVTVVTSAANGGDVILSCLQIA
jgi:hypothetical protein